MDFTEDGAACYRSLVQLPSAGQVPVRFQMRWSVPSTRIDVEPFGADPAPTPVVDLPPRVCQPGLTPAVVPANSLYQVALSVPRMNTTPTPGAGVATPTSPLPRPPSDLKPDQWAPS